MKRLIFMCVIYCSVLISHGSDDEERPFSGDQVLRLHLNDEQLEDLQQLTDVFELDFWKTTRIDGISVDVRIPSKFVDQFKKFLSDEKITYRVFIEDVQELVENEREPHPKPTDLASFNYTVYHPFDEIQKWIDDMVLEYPDLASKDVVGKTFEGRTFSALTISAQPGNPKFVLNCGIHAREWITPATCMYSAMLLVTEYRRRDVTTQYLLNNVDFVFIPSSNPDGYAYSWSQRRNRLWRKTRSVYESGRCIGADPNRNWDINFCGEGASSLQCMITYCGPTPFSEPCTEGQRSFVEGLKNVKAYIDVHSYSQLWMYPYSDKYSRAADFEVLDEIARQSVEAIKFKHGMTYISGQSSIIIYIASGTTSDYFYEKAGIKCSFTAEVRDTGEYGFLLPADQIQPTAEECFEAFKVMAKSIIDGKCDRNVVE